MRTGSFMPETPASTLETSGQHPSFGDPKNHRSPLQTKGAVSVKTSEKHQRLVEMAK